MVRRKVGVRKRRAVREGNILVGNETNAAAGQRSVAVRGCGHQRRLVVAGRGGGRWRRFALASRLALGEVEGASRRTSLATRWW